MYFAQTSVIINDRLITVNIEVYTDTHRGWLREGSRIILVGRPVSDRRFL